jgi:opacity protein-like surface antigen
MKTALAVISLLFCFFAPNLYAANQYQFEVFGLGGLGWLHDDESYLGSGLDVGGGVFLRPIDRIGFSFEVDRVSFTRNFPSGVHFGGDASSYIGNVHLYFPAENVEPYLFGGAGVVRFSERSRFPDEPVDFESSTDSFAIVFGGGVRVVLSRHFSLRPEFRWTTNDISFINQIRASAALGYGW